MNAEKRQATPTVIIGITSTPNPTTVFTTIGTQTQTLILAPPTITAACTGSTTTVTVTPTKDTVIITSVVVRTTTDRITTKLSTTTTTKTAYCHYDEGTRPTGTICIGNGCNFPPPDLPAPTICVGVYCPRPAVETARVADTPTKGVQEVVKVVMATTITVTETTYTVTSTSVTLLPTPTATESVIKTITATVTPQPSTICSGQKPGVTVSLTRPQATVTQTSLDYSTIHVTGTVTAVTTKTTVYTNSKSATSCFYNGGWMGAD
ncbi:hypothetical protein E0Z10_g9691 [Xylaria hypoxylon]|uniref:Uncharacterized protein n=1 Tax=Xylaria hypoxylon TaxID=37992 RepID=A0A4Z0Y4T1_9PEZI|nr:hypothetical protein E0Z10_g9691 [Xylaria hypoxylon]